VRKRRERKDRGRRGGEETGGREKTCVAVLLVSA
jgi:hypothetical protein